MAVASDVRLVRCPKCENLLPELPDFSLYQCGGCGAVLKAKKNGFLEDGLLKISDDVEGIRTSEAGDATNVSQVPMESADLIERGRVAYIHNERVASIGSSMSQAESAEELSSSNARKKGKERMRRREDLDDEYSSYSQGFHNRYEGRNGDLKVDRTEYVNVHSADTFNNIRPPVESLRSRPFTGTQGVKSKGHSSYNTNYYYEQGDRRRFPDRDRDGLSRVEESENGRAELLRKLDELKDQLSRSCEVTETSKGRIGTNQRMDSPTLPDPYPRHHAAYLQDGVTSSHGENKQQLRPDDITAAYLSQNPGFIPYRDGYGPSLQDSSYPIRGHPYEFQGYADTPRQEIFQRLHHQPQSQYMYWPHNEHSHGFYDRVNHHLVMLHPHENYFHQPACSCVHCCNKYWHLPPKVGPSGLYDQRSQNEPSNPNYHHHLNPLQHGPGGYSSGDSRLHTLYSQQPLTSNSTDVDYEIELNHQRPRKVVLAHRSGQVCQPILGGAPFIACSNCFELLKLSRKHISPAKNQQKMKCGACSSIILLELGNKGLTMSVSAHVDHVPTEIDDGSSVTVDENVKILHGDSNGANRNACSDDYDDSVPQFPPTDLKSNSGESEKLLGHLSSTLSISEDEKIRENLSAELQLTQLTEVESFQHPDFPSSECPENCYDDVVVSRFDKGNKSKRSEVDQSTSEHNSVNNPAVATEMDMSLNEFSNSCVSQDSMDNSGEAHPMVSKGTESFFTGLIKKGFKDFTKSKQTVEVGGSQVFVNGHLIPDHLVKKAEKLAGAVQPGEYWYDIQAGFWGVMGHPCLGIVMPNIEEFNYPMPENCAAGNTGVFVNGRELHQKDLDLLVSRGLPKTRNKSYLIEITGKVVDRHTQEELDSLGKLAPTVERAKHGFGMKSHDVMDSISDSICVAVLVLFLGSQQFLQRWLVFGRSCWDAFEQID
ncbi:hypothetical protein Sango_2257200 [Sesamum angolense]|uniref:Zinc-ribbon domain-containing protein n=1 Tax=Sesamum angolense TaxID=2727404 RepID=A0AAE1W9E1_9LAMI|nr:hypothetical protein Sango_2257200 [Sesamum angolense]